MLLTGNSETKEMIMIIAVFALLIVGGLLIYGIQERLNKKRAQTGEDKRNVLDIIRRFVPDSERYTLAYGTWEKKEYFGRRTITHYWYYGIAFDEERIWLVPVTVEKGELVGKDGGVIEKNSLGMVNGVKGENWMSLYNMNREEIVTVRVAKENLKEDRYHLVNILQPAEEEAFRKLVEQWMEDVNTTYGITVSGVYGKPLKKKR